MPKFRYNGDHKEMLTRGYDFSNGTVVNVPEEDTLAIGKFTNNSHFDNVDGEVVAGTDDLDDSEIKKMLESDESAGNEKWGIFKKKKDKSPYSNPDKVLGGELELHEVEAYIKENYDNPDDYIIMKK